MKMKLTTKLILAISFSLILSLFASITFSQQVTVHYIIPNNGYITPFTYTVIALSTFTIGISVFITTFLFISRKRIQYIRYTATKINEIANGELGLKIDVIGRDELADLASNINTLSKELKLKFDYEREVEQQKNELIANISHDLRTPLTSIIGYLKLVREEENIPTESRHEYLNIVYEKAIRLKGLIDELFEYTKVTSQGVTLEKTKIDLKEMIEQYLEEVIPIAEEENLLIKKEIPPPKVFIAADPNSLIRVFENLMSNAIKYSVKPGTIEIKMKRTEGHAVVSFINTASDITHKELSMIFERFYKVDKSRSDIEGSGLGLAIAKSIVHLHDGEIWAEQTDKHIQFHVSLPIV